jgi:hypothetical protein
VAEGHPLRHVQLARPANTTAPAVDYDKLAEARLRRITATQT